MHFSELADDCQPQSQPAVTARIQDIGLRKRAEHVRQEMRFYSLAGIRDNDVRFVSISLQLDADLSAFRSEFDGVRQQIPDNLLHSQRLTLNHHGMLWHSNSQADFRRFGSLPHRFQSGFDNHSQVDGFERKVKFAGYDSRDIEKIVYEPGLQSRSALDCIEPLIQKRRLNRASTQEPRPSQDGRQRRAKLVRQRGEENIFRPARSFEILINALKLAGPFLDSLLLLPVQPLQVA